MNQKLKWGLISIATFIFFFLLIPVGIFYWLYYLIVLVGSCAITFSLTKLTAEFFKEDKVIAEANQVDGEEVLEVENAKPIDAAGNGCFIVFMIVVCFFVMIALLILRDIRLEENELKKYGRVTDAVVNNGSSYSSRKYDFTNLIIGFADEKGDSIFVKHSISASQFNNYYKFQKIVLVYSTRYPRILKIIEDDKELIKYLKSEADTTGRKH